MINTKVCPKCEGTGVVIAYHSNCTVGARHAYTLPSGKRTNKCILCGIKKS
jgi:ribosomal protein S27AE